MASMADVSAFKYFNINMYLPVVLVVHCAMVMLGVDKCGEWIHMLPKCRAGRRALHHGHARYGDCGLKFTHASVSHVYHALWSAVTS